MKTLTIKGKVYACPFADAYEAHSPDELRTLDESIARVGVLDSVGVYDSPKHGPSVYDGVTRAVLAQKHGKPVPVEDFGGLDDEAAERLLDEKHLGRRNLSPAKQKARREARIERVTAKRQAGKSIRIIAEEEHVSKTQVERDLFTVPPGTEMPEKVTGKDGRKQPAKRKPKPAGKAKSPAGPVVIPTFAEYAERLDRAAAALDAIGEVAFNVRGHLELRHVFDTGPKWTTAADLPVRETCDEAERLKAFAGRLAAALRSTKHVPLTESDLKRIHDAAEEAKGLDRGEKWRAAS